MKLEAFRAALAQNPEATESISQRTRERYVSSRPPRILVWLDQHPKLLEDWAAAKRQQQNTEQSNQFGA